MRYIDNDISRCRRGWKCIVVKTSPLGCRELQSDTTARVHLVVADPGHVGRGSCVIVIEQWVLDVADDGHLRDDSIFWCTARSTLVEHTETGKVASGLVARV